MHNATTHRNIDATGLKVGQQIWSIQYLRAFAAVAVIFFHLLYSLPLMWLGEHGVDLFFVISGFMMVIMTDGKDVVPGRFMLDRITRVVPLYWLATLLTMAATLFGIDMFAASADRNRLVTSLLFIPAYGTQGHIWPTLYLGWTLNYEMFFYAVYALCLLAPRDMRVPALSVVLGMCLLIGIVFQPTGAVLRTWSDPLLLEFAAGAWLGTISGRNNDRFAPRRMFVLMLGVALLLLTASMAAPRLIYGAASVSIVAAGLYVERLGRLPRIAMLKRLGDASYSIYLFQGFAFAAVAYGLSVATARTGVQLNLIRFSAPIGIVLAIVLGYAVSLLIERPVTTLLRGRSERISGAARDSA